jgi:hypothetical protein
MMIVIIFLSFFLLASSKDCKILPLPAAAPFHFLHCKNSGKPQNAQIFLTVSSSSSSSVWNSSLVMEIG